MPPFGRLTKRSEFVRVAEGSRFHTTTFSLQASRRPAPMASDPTDGTSALASSLAGAVARFGLTVTKKVGGAVERNRIRRRLREVLRLTPSLAARPDFDYVVLARREALTAPFPVLVGDLDHALRRIHDQRRKPKRSPGGEPGPDRALVEMAVRPADIESLASVTRTPHSGHGRADSGRCDQDQ